MDFRRIFLPWRVPGIRGCPRELTPMIAFDLLRATPLATDPFDHVIVPGFVQETARAALAADFPAIDRPGSFPLSELHYGPAFADLVAALQGPEMAATMAEKFSIALGEHPTMI